MLLTVICCCSVIWRLQLRKWTFMYGKDDDLLPCDFLNVVDKDLYCRKPPCDPAYTGIGYILLGFIAQSLRNQSHWTDWNREFAIFSVAVCLCA